MSERTKTLHDVAAGWDSEAGVLRHWEHDRQARVVTLCREALEEQIATEGRVSVGTVLNVWSSDAEVLADYGHREEATALRRCVDTLREAVHGGDGEAPEDAGEEGADEAYLSRHYGRERADGDGNGGSAGEAVGAEEASGELGHEDEEAPLGRTW